MQMTPELLLATKLLTWHDRCDSPFVRQGFFSNQKVDRPKLKEVPTCYKECPEISTYVTYLDGRIGRADTKNSKECYQCLAKKAEAEEYNEEQEEKQRAKCNEMAEEVAKAIEGFRK